MAKKFEFGKNWKDFLKVLNEERISEAEKSLKEMLELESLEGKSFIDVGSGSGLFSLAAMRLGAAKVYSFDCDIESVECTKELKRRYFHDANNWIIEKGDVLDKEYLSKLEQFDVVYSWGVLHHTGDMWKGLENVMLLVKPSGVLFTAIYNDQGRLSRIWWHIKRCYNKWPKFAKVLILLSVIMYFEIRSFVGRILKFQNPLPFKYWREYKKSRGMSRLHDYVDWVGGYPFEVAKPEDIFEFYKKRGFVLKKLKTAGGKHGNNQFVFSRIQ